MFVIALAPSYLQIIGSGRTIAIGAVSNHAQCTKTTACPGTLPSHRSHHHPFSGTELTLCLTLPRCLSLGGSCRALGGGTRGSSSGDDDTCACGSLCSGNRLETALLAETLFRLSRRCGVCCNLFLPAQLLHRDRRNFKFDLLCRIVKFLYRERNFTHMHAVRQSASFWALVAVKPLWLWLVRQQETLRNRCSLDGRASWTASFLPVITLFRPCLRYRCPEPFQSGSRRRQWETLKHRCSIGLQHTHVSICTSWHSYRHGLPFTAD